MWEEWFGEDNEVEEVDILKGMGWLGGGVDMVRGIRWRRGGCGYCEGWGGD